MKFRVQHVYIGETGWTLKKRLKEYDYAVRRYDPNNGIVDHTWQNDHRVNWEAAKVRLVEHNPKKRKALEAIAIKKEILTSNVTPAGGPPSSERLFCTVDYVLVLKIVNRCQRNSWCVTWGCLLGRYHKYQYMPIHKYYVRMAQKRTQPGMQK